MTDQERFKKIEDEIDAELKESKFYYGSWDELRKVIDRLEEDENIAAGERSMERLIEDGGYSSSEEAERMYKIQRDLK